MLKNKNLSGGSNCKIQVKQMVIHFYCISWLSLYNKSTINKGVIT